MLGSICNQPVDAGLQHERNWHPADRQAGKRQGGSDFHQSGHEPAKFVVKFEDEFKRFALLRSHPTGCIECGLVLQEISKHIESGWRLAMNRGAFHYVAEPGLDTF
jgi:hypothetical protein